MSSFRATLELGGKEYDVLYSNYEFSRTTDKKGQPASSISGGRISVTIESTDDTSTIEAMLNSQFKPVEGKIVYKKSEEDAKMKEISFKNAYIVHYKETLDVNNEAPMTIAMTFSAENITVEGIVLYELPVGTKLQLGHEVLLEVTQIGKECHHGCEIMKQVGSCIMPTQGIFGKVLKNGTINIGDEVSIIK